MLANTFANGPYLNVLNGFSELKLYLFLPKRIVFVYLEVCMIAWILRSQYARWFEVFVKALSTGCKIPTAAW